MNVQINLQEIISKMISYIIPPCNGVTVQGGIFIEMFNKPLWLFYYIGNSSEFPILLFWAVPLLLYFLQQ